MNGCIARSPVCGGLSQPVCYAWPCVLVLKVWFVMHRFVLCLIAFLMGGAQIAKPTCAQDGRVKAVWQLYQQRQLERAIEEGNALLDERPDDPALHLVVGRALVDDAQFARSVPYLERADALDTPPTWISAWALNFLGKAAFALGRFEVARASFQESAQLEATRNATRSSRRWLTTLGLTPRYDDWSVQETAHFVFRFEPALDGIDQPSFAVAREEAFQAVADTFGVAELPHTVQFFVWSSNDAARDAGLPSLGFARPAYGFIHAQVNQTVGHEITHIAVYHGVEPEQRTGLINEGIAVYFDQTDRDRYAVARAALQQHGAESVSIRTLWTDWDAWPSRVTYPVAGAFVQGLIEAEGMAKLRQLARDQTLDHAQQIYGDDLDAIIRDVEQRIRP